MGIPKATIQAVGKGATAPLAQSISKKVSAHTKGAAATSALAVHPAPTATRIGQLYAMLTSDGAAERSLLLDVIVQRLRKDLPTALGTMPLKLTHFGFSRVEHLVQYLSEGLATMQTGASSQKEFRLGIEGWRRNLVGRLLFERLVKFHPLLDQFFQKAAGDLFALVNAEITRKGSGKTLVDAAGDPRAVTTAFGKPLKVLEFSLVGEDGVTRAYTDFGFISNNKQGLWAFLPIELKMPIALRKVADQFEQFLPRLLSAREVIAHIDDEGTHRTIRIVPSDFVFLEHDRAQMVVAPLSDARHKALQAGGKTITSSEVASIAEVKSVVSAKHGLLYYRVRIVVLREWLESIVRVITGPP